MPAERAPEQVEKVPVEDDAGAAVTEVAVVITTRNRPALLDEAIDSALAQSIPPAEVIVVDDASDPPVDEQALRSRHGCTVRLLRNDTSRGLAFSRNRGVEAATAGFVVHLDDDDLLARNALSRLRQAAARHPDVQTWFFGVKGFGERSEHFNEVQPAGVERVCAAADGQRSDDGVVVFGQRLFPVLLHRVPVAFQRVFTRRATWTAISRARWRVYMGDPAVADEEAAKLAITGTLRDSEWARYAAAVCARIGYVDDALYLQRCDGQGYSSQPSQQRTHGLQNRLILQKLLDGTNTLPALAKWHRQIKRALSASNFDLAYQLSTEGRTAEARALVIDAIRLDPRPKGIKLLLELLLGVHAKRRQAIWPTRHPK